MGNKMRRTGDKTEEIKLRIDKKMKKFIREYALYKRMTLSEAVRIFVREGALIHSYAGLLMEIQNRLKGRDWTKVKCCEKCGSGDEIGYYHIDGNPTNLKPENIICLCRRCLNGLNRFLRDYDKTKRFVEWYYS